MRTADRVMKNNRPLDAIRRKVRREWRGFDEPLDLNAGVRRAAEFVDDIIRMVGMTDGMEEQRLRAIWIDLAGEYVAKGSEPVSLKKGVLTIRVSQPAMKFHLEQMRGSLLAKIQQAAANGKITSLRFTAG